MSVFHFLENRFRGNGGMAIEPSPTTSWSESVPAQPLVRFRWGNDAWALLQWLTARHRDHRSRSGPSKPYSQIVVRPRTWPQERGMV